MAGVRGAPHPESTVFKCEYAPDRLKYLVKLDIPEEYYELESGFYIFRVVWPDEVMLSEFDYESALAALKDYDYDAAADLARSAYYHIPGYSNYETYCKIFAMFPPRPSLEFYLGSGE